MNKVYRFIISIFCIDCYQKSSVDVGKVNYTQFSPCYQKFYELVNNFSDCMSNSNVIFSIRIKFSSLINFVYRSLFNFFEFLPKRRSQAPFPSTRADRRGLDMILPIPFVRTALRFTHLSRDNLRPVAVLLWTGAAAVAMSSK